jgi:shikimate kinase
MLITDMFSAFKQGKQLANSETWKNRAILGNTLTALLIALVAIAKGFGYDLPITDETLELLATGIAAVFTSTNAIVHVVTSEKVGLRGKPVATDP